MRDELERDESRFGEDPTGEEAELESEDEEEGVKELEGLDEEEL